jgi:hypothetical protein
MLARRTNCRVRRECLLAHWKGAARALGANRFGGPQFLCGPRLFEQAELCGRLAERTLVTAGIRGGIAPCSMSVVASVTLVFLWPLRSARKLR